MELLDPVEARVLGALMEKEVTTPEYYPLSLNALVNACNQKSNRDPVVDYDEDTVEDAVHRLRQKQFSFLVTGNGRVNKYRQRLSETLNLGRRESAVLCSLLLRGPQTLGEIKDRSERMYSFADLAETEMVLDKLADWTGGALMKKLPRQPGQKEARYAQLLCGEPEFEAVTETVAAHAPTGKVAQLELEMQQLRAELSELRLRFDALEAQWK
ncbi:MAG TPA: YceH family protein [Bryobacteraceae bacterium]|nr:YceH family protein [Bryobacteraceae bacterium]